MSLSGRVVFKTRVFDTTEVQSQFAPLPADLGYRQAISKSALATGAGPVGRATLALYGSGLVLKGYGFGRAESATK